MFRSLSPTFRNTGQKDFKMDISLLVRSDAELKTIDEGAWVGDLEGAPGLELYVLGLESEAVSKARTAKLEALKIRNKGRAATQAQLNKVGSELLSEYVLKDWRGLKDGGKELPYTQELATQYLTSRNGERFAQIVTQAAQTLDINAADYTEALKKS